MMRTRKLLLPTIAVIALGMAAACSPGAPTDATLESRVAPGDSAVVAAPELRALDNQLPGQSTQTPDFASRPRASAQGTALEADQPATSGAGGAAVALDEVSRLRGVSKSNIAEWRKALDRIARVSKRGETAVVLRRMVLDALDAPSDGEYRRILQGLRAQMAARGKNVGSGDASALSRGQDDTRAGSPRGRIQGADQWGTAVSSEAFPEGDEIEGSASRPHFDFAEVFNIYPCSTMWEGIVYEGECATQEEIDDALAIMEAVMAEVTADYTEAEAECTNRFGNECPAITDEEQLLEALAVSSTTWPSSSAVHVTSWDMAGREDREDADGLTCRAAENPFDIGQAADLGCLGEAAAAVGSMSGLVATWIGGDSLLRGGGVSKLAKFGIKAAVLGGSFAAGYYIGSWISCML